MSNDPFVFEYAVGAILAIFTMAFGAIIYMILTEIWDGYKWKGIGLLCAVLGVFWALTKTIAEFLQSLPHG